MKKHVNYRTITVAIGVVVAVVIALTLWMWRPGYASLPSKPQSMVPDVKHFFKAAATLAERTFPFIDSGAQ